MSSDGISPEVSYLLSTQAIRDKSHEIFESSLNGHTHFEVHQERLAGVASLVADVTRKNYPDLKIPYHSRWSHFEAFGKERVESLFKTLELVDSHERGRVELDLIIVSVLLDAGAGPSWSYQDKELSKSIGRSEGLGVASFDAFVQGRFSSDSANPLRVDGEKLRTFTVEELKEIFQLSETNPLEGLEGRLKLLKNLGERLVSEKDFFKAARPGGLLDYWQTRFPDKQMEAETLLQTLLMSLGPIWPSRLTKDGIPLGDVWEYKGELVAFHKLSQWLSYSLLDTFQRAGWELFAIDALTGLAEYRNGGLFVDTGVLVLRDESQLGKSHAVDSELVIEWRALTLALLEALVPYVRNELKIPDLALPKILEGGTWWAGRKVAAEKREDLSPPINIISDGTVF